MDTTLPWRSVENLFGHLTKAGKKKKAPCDGPSVVNPRSFLKTPCWQKALSLGVFVWRCMDETNPLDCGGTTLRPAHNAPSSCLVAFYVKCFLRCDSFRDPAEYVIDSPFCASPARPCCIWGARELLSCDTWKWNPVRNGSCPCEFGLYSNPSQSWRVCAAYNVSQRARHREVSLLAPY